MWNNALLHGLLSKLCRPMYEGHESLLSIIISSCLLHKLERGCSSGQIKAIPWVAAWSGRVKVSKWGVRILGGSPCKFVILWFQGVGKFPNFPRAHACDSLSGCGVRELRCNANLLQSASSGSSQPRPRICVVLESRLVGVDDSLQVHM